MNHINCKMHNVIVNMYHNVKSRIMHNNDFPYILFTCVNGVRKGVFVPPFLFSIYLNDLKTSSDELEQELGYCVKLFVIMYADDTALLAESAGNLHNMVNIFQEYCIKWKLK